MFIYIFQWDELWVKNKNYTLVDKVLLYTIKKKTFLNEQISWRFSIETLFSSYILHSTYFPTHLNC